MRRRVFRFGSEARATVVEIRRTGLGSNMILSFGSRCWIRLGHDTQASLIGARSQVFLPKNTVPHSQLDSERLRSCHGDRCSGLDDGAPGGRDHSHSKHANEQEICES